MCDVIIMPKSELHHTNGFPKHTHGLTHLLFVTITLFVCEFTKMTTSVKEAGKKLVVTNCAVSKRVARDGKTRERINVLCTCTLQIVIFGDLSRSRVISFSLALNFGHCMVCYIALCPMCQPFGCNKSVDKIKVWGNKFVRTTLKWSCYSCVVTSTLLSKWIIRTVTVAFCVQ